MNNLLQNFLEQDKENNKLYEKYKTEDDLVALQKLNEKFQKHVFEI